LYDLNKRNRMMDNVQEQDNGIKPVNFTLLSFWRKFCMFPFWGNIERFYVTGSLEKLGVSGYGKAY
jgi:hypothetical protein